MSNILIVGTVSNVGKHLESEISVLKKAFSSFEIIHFYLVESDSTDNTLRVLRELSKNDKNFQFISLGNLRSKFPERISRIRHCRNVYVKYIRNMGFDTFDYVVVADLDGMNLKLTPESVASCFEHLDWDGVFANQKYGYYDILALRHKIWNPNDCMKELEFHQSMISNKRVTKYNLIRKIRIILEFDRARRIAIYSKMKLINRNLPWIRVDSAFGGLGIYKADFFRNFDYGPDQVSNSSEHVYIHNLATEKGRNFYINPNLINNNFNTYNINRFFIIRQARMFIWNHRKIVILLKHIRNIFVLD